MIVLKSLLAGIRLALFIVLIVVMYLLFLMSIKTFVKYDLKKGFKLRRDFLSIINPILGIKNEVFGKPINQPAIYISNHRGLLDFFVTLKYLDTYILSKEEVRHIPILGKASELTGIFFVKREDKSSRRATREAIKQIISSGYNVLIFIEGTTNINKLTAEFKRGTFEVAAENNIPVVPIAEEYKYKDDLWKDNSMWRQWVMTTGKLTTPVKMSFGPALQSDDPDYLLKESKRWIDGELLKLQKDWSLAYE
ncbi:MAG TPA: 1-acyl-sn-glycerol-3-phosphate acyltransferase [Bacteroidetes bacterium]|nr:1-acyl-sn-glycerol-3-phosphate acyltransferase [Bacteroidota bacterium]